MRDTQSDKDELLRILTAMEANKDNSGNDCPEELIKLAKTPFERTVCIEFYKLYKEFQAFKIKCTADMKWLKWLISGVFALTAIALVVQLITNVFGHFL